MTARSEDVQHRYGRFWTGAAPGGGCVRAQHSRAAGMVRRRTAAITLKCLILRQGGGFWTGVDPAGLNIPAPTASPEDELYW